MHDDLIYAQRVPWPDDFPDVITHSEVKLRDKHVAYREAKAGGHLEALVLAWDLINPIVIPLKNFTVLQKSNFLRFRYARTTKSASGILYYID